MSDILVADLARSCLRVFLSVRGLPSRIALPRGGRYASSSEPTRSAPAEDVPSGALDPAFARVMVFVFVATRGGANRARVVRALRDEPMNANRLGERLGLDYKTVQHHLSVLEENAVVVRTPPRRAAAGGDRSQEQPPSSPSGGGAYGAVYFLSPHFERHMDQLEAIWVQSGKK